MRDAHDSLKGPTHDNPNRGLHPSDQFNKTSWSEYKTEQTMGKKIRVNNLYDQRNGLPMTSLGDKNYKHPDYTPGFFKEGGLITGSTN